MNGPAATGKYDDLPRLEALIEQGPEGEAEYRRVVMALLGEHARKRGGECVALPRDQDPETSETHDTPQLASYRGLLGGQQLKTVLVKISSAVKPLSRSGHQAIGARQREIDPDLYIHVRNGAIDVLQWSSRDTVRKRSQWQPAVERDGLPERLEALLPECSSLLARYRPEHPMLREAGRTSCTLAELKISYKKKLIAQHQYLPTFGLPPEALREVDAAQRIELDQVFVPLQLQLQSQDKTQESQALQQLFQRGQRQVILGDPGAGKTTLLSYLTLLYAGHTTLAGYATPPERVPLLISVRDYIREQKKAPGYSFIHFLRDRACSDFSLPEAHAFHFEALLLMGEAVVLFDGLDEGGSEMQRAALSQAIVHFVTRYPRCPVWVTSRIYGYTAEVTLPADQFTHYRVAPLDDNQITRFIDQWYAVQLRHHPREQQTHRASLREAVDRTPSVRRLAGNPLLLTLMAFIHQGLRKLPNDRGELYDKCVEMLLKSWREAKQLNRDTQSAFDRLSLHLSTQKDYLAHLAMHMQERAAGADDEGRAVITREEALRVLAERHQAFARRERPGLSLEMAREEMAAFLEYAGGEGGLLLDRGGGQYSFLHLSFQEYLAASLFLHQSELAEPQFFIAHLEDSAWKEVLLLRLYLILHREGGGGARVFDAIVLVLREQLARTPSDAGLLLLLHALRDNLQFQPTDRSGILQDGVKQWLQAPAFDGIWFEALEAIALFAPAMVDALHQELDRGIAVETPVAAAACVHLLIRLFGVDRVPVTTLASRSELRGIYADLCGYWQAPALGQWLAQMAQPTDYRDWLVEIGGAASDSLVLSAMEEGRQLPAALEQGLLADQWARMWDELASRRAFIKRFGTAGPRGLRLTTSLYQLQAPYAAVAPIHDLPTRGVEAAMPLCWPMLLDSQMPSRPPAALEAASTTLIRQVLTPRATPAQPVIATFAATFVRDFGRDFGRDFIHDFFRYFGRDFIRRFGRHFVRDFVHHFGHGFVRYFFDHFGGYYSRNFVRDVGSDFFHHFVRDFGLQPEATAEEWALVLRLLNDPHAYWSRSVRSEAVKKTAATALALALHNPLALPWMLMDLGTLIAAHHLATTARHLTLDPPEEDEELLDQWAVRLHQHPIDAHLSALGWEEHAKRYAAAHANQLHGLPGALYLSHGAYAALMSGLACDHPDRPTATSLLSTADLADPRIRLSHALYHLCHFRDQEAAVRTIDALIAAPDPQLVPILQAAGLLPRERPSILTTDLAAAVPAEPVRGIVSSVSSLHSVEPAGGIEDGPDPTIAFAWLHLSDLHLGHGDAEHQWDQQRVLAALADDLAQLPRTRPGLQPEAVLVTGDLAFSGRKEQYDAARELLRKLTGPIGLDLRAVYAVPGNHDVDRTVESRERNIRRLLRDLRDGDETIDDVLDDDNDSRLLAQRQHAYLELARELAPAARATRSDPSHKRLFWHEQRKSRAGLPLRLVGLNTALLAADNQDKGKLRLGKQQTTRPFIEPRLTPDELVLVLSHHPLTEGWLADEKDARIAVRKFAQIHLCGHVHEPESEDVWRGIESKGHVRIVAGAVHNEKGATEAHGYNLAAVMRNPQGQWVVRIWPRRYAEAKHGYVDDTDRLPDGQRHIDHPLTFP